VLFESDPGEKHAYLALGAPERKDVSPALFLASHFLVGGVAEIVEAIGGDAKTVDTQLRIALWIVPVLSGVKAVLTFVLLASLGIGTTTAGVLSLASVFLFSNLIFGTIPESYGVSGACLTALLCMAVVALRRARDFPLWAWIAISAATLATLVSNVFIVTIVVGSVFATLRPGLARAARDLALAGIAAVSLTFGVAYGLDRATAHSFLYASPSQLAAAATIQAGEPVEASAPAPTTAYTSARPAALVHDETPWWRTTWLADTALGRLPSERGSNNHVFEWLLRYDPIERATIGFPYAVADSIVATTVTLVNDEPYGPSSMPRLTTVTEATVDPRTGLATIAVLTVLAAGAILMVRSGGAHRTIALMCTAILAYNGLFHTVWGGPEIFLYSQHWLPAAIVLLAGIALPAAPASRQTVALRATLCIAVAAAVAVNLLVLAQVADAIGSHSA
jgi:hypothetical protein